MMKEYETPLGNLKLELNIIQQLKQSVDFENGTPENFYLVMGRGNLKLWTWRWTRMNIVLKCSFLF